MNQPPEFIITPEPVEINLGENAEFFCQVRGKPLPDLVWYKDIPMKKDEDLTNVQTTDDLENSVVESKAIIEEIQLEDEGKYKVKATNSVGMVKCEVPVSGK